MFGGFDDIFGNMDRMMNNMNNMMNMMNGNLMMGSPFPQMGGMNSIMNNHMQLMNNQMNNQLSLFGGPSNMSSFSMTSMPGQAVSYSSKVMHISNDGSGRPQVYEQTSSQICGPNGIRETKETVKDSRTGLQQIKVGRHINDRGHLKQKKRNVYNGEEEEEDEYLNLDEEEVEQFHNEYNTKTREYKQKYQSIAHPSSSRSRLALTNGPSSTTQQQQQQQQQQIYNPDYNNLRATATVTEDTRPPSRQKTKLSKEQKEKLKKKSKKPY